MKKLTLKDQLSPLWVAYKINKSQEEMYKSQKLVAMSERCRSMALGLAIAIEELVIRYYDGEHIDSENRAHAEMVLEILGVY
jgi:hypothetical protein